MKTKKYKKVTPKEGEFVKKPIRKTILIRMEDDVKKGLEKFKDDLSMNQLMNRILREWINAKESDRKNTGK